MSRSVSAADLTARVSRLRAEITELVGADADIDGVTGPGLHAELATAAGQLRAFAARVLARVEADGRWAAEGARSFGDWMARRRLASPGAVRREVTLGRELDSSLPGTARAVAAGEVSIELAQVLASVAATSEARRAALDAGGPGADEAGLLALARRLPVASFRREVDRWAVQVDAASAEAEHQAACAKEHLTFARRRDGFALTGFLTVEHGVALATALRAVAGVPPAGDTRTRQERQAQALVDAGRLILDRGLAGSGNQVCPHLLVHVPLEALRALEADGGDPAAFDPLALATLADGEPIPASALARPVCDGELSRIVFSATGAVLDVGRAPRTYTGPQRLAIIARDQSCRCPGCGAPVALCEVRHVVSWLTGGHGRQWHPAVLAPPRTRPPPRPTDHPRARPMAIPPPRRHSPPRPRARCHRRLAGAHSLAARRTATARTRPRQLGRATRPRTRRPDRPVPLTPHAVPLPPHAPGRGSPEPAHRPGQPAASSTARPIPPRAAGVAARFPSMGQGAPRPRRHSFAGAPAWLMAAAISVALPGCSADPEPPPPTTVTSTTPTQTPTPTPTETTPAPPEMPAAMDRGDETGAIAAAEYFMAVHEWTYSTGDVSLWSAIAGPDCDFCTKVTSTVSTAYADGGWIESEPSTFKGFRSVGFDEQLVIYAIALTVEAGESTIYSPQGETLSTFQAENTSLVLEVGPSARGWLLFGGAAESSS